MWFALLNRNRAPQADGAEFADDQPVLVDRVVVQDVVLFELCRVVHEIVVDRVVADLDIGVVDHRIQIDRPAVVRAGICFRIHRVFRCAAFAGPPHFLQNCEKIPANRRSGDEIFPLAGICRSTLAGKELRGMRLPAAIPASGEYQPGIYFLHLQP